jgi:hypothetical protein
MHLQQATYEKFLRGDPLTNYEVRSAVLFHKELSDNLFKMGPAFALAAKESNRVFLEIRSFLNSREEHQQ